MTNFRIPNILIATIITMGSKHSHHKHHHDEKPKNAMKKIKCPYQCDNGFNEIRVPHTCTVCNGLGKLFISGSDIMTTSFKCYNCDGYGKIITIEHERCKNPSCVGGWIMVPN